MTQKAAVKPAGDALPPAMMQQFQDAAGCGFEDTTAEDFSIPFLFILQSNSKQCKKSEGEYIKGAEEGMLFDTVSNAIFDGEAGLDLLICGYRRVFMEWRPRNEGGGLRGIHSVADGLKMLRSCSKNDKGKDVLPNGNELMDTRELYLMYRHPETGDMHHAIVSASSTQIKKAKKLMSVLQGIHFPAPDGTKFQAPIFSHWVHATTVPESNEQGSWMGWKLVVGEQLNDQAIAARAFKFYNDIKAGVANVDHSALDPNAGEGGETRRSFDEDDGVDF